MIGNLDFDSQLSPLFFLLFMVCTVGHEVVSEWEGDDEK